MDHIGIGRCVFILLLLAAPGLYGQKITNKKDTVFFDRKPAIIMQSQSYDHYIFKSLDGTPLLEMHNSKTEAKNKQVWIATFYNNKRKAAFIKAKRSKYYLARLVHDSRLIDGNLINAAEELKFLTSHPLPEGYIDIDEVVEY